MGAFSVRTVEASMGDLCVKKNTSITMVLHSLPPGKGGMERQAYLQALELSKFTNLTVLACSTDRDLFKKTEASFYCVRPYTGKLAKEVNALRVFYRFLRRNLASSADIIYVHQVNILTFMVLLYSFFSRKKVFIKIANSGSKFDIKTFFQRYPFLYPFKQIFAIKNVSYLVLNGENYKDFSNLSINPKVIHPFRNGVTYCKQGPVFSNSVPGNILFLGRLVPQKRLDRVLDLADLMPERKFYIVGNGPLFNDLANKSVNKKKYYYVRGVRTCQNTMGRQRGLTGGKGGDRRKPAID